MLTRHRARREIQKALQGIRLTLAPLTSRIDRGLGHKILIGTHHRAGTSWMANIFRRISKELGLVYYFGRQETLPARFDVFFEDHSRFDLARLKGAYRGLHMIRDPRDVIVSGCFYHQRSQEKWLHVRRGQFGGLSYQQKLNSYRSLDDKLMFEMEHHGNTILDMLGWSYSNPAFFEARYEDLIADRSLTQFRHIFTFLGFPEAAILRLLQIAYDGSLVSGNIKSSLHVRSGETGQWRTYFRPAHKTRFLELFGDALIRLGYESSDDWASG